MSKAVMDVSASLDGFTTGPNARVRPDDDAAVGAAIVGRPYLRPRPGPVGQHAVAGRSDASRKFTIEEAL